MECSKRVISRISREVANKILRTKKICERLQKSSIFRNHSCFFFSVPMAPAPSFTTQDSLFAVGENEKKLW